MISTPYHKYQQSSVQTASPAQLILMLYDGAIRFIKQGVEGIETKDYQKANHNLIRAQHIVNELIASLNHEYPIAGNLLEIYDYANRKLIESNMKKNKQAALEVASILGELRESWVQILKSTNPVKDNV
ncbi:flagellar export chaperone FliS [Cohnella boryungensis]|uniref:Flagellar secretion chaperone FliS n=1 Tax=Cohnella boryungensis TaxID=768479 RepID=A0ABV8S790_9BACL